MHTAQLMPLPLTVSCFSKIQIGFTFLVPAHLGSPGKRAVKWVCVTSQMHGGKGGGVCSLFERRSHAISLTVRNSGRSGAFATCRGTLILLYRPYPLLNTPSSSAHTSTLSAFEVSCTQDNSDDNNRSISVPVDFCRHLVGKTTTTTTTTTV